MSAIVPVVARAAGFGAVVGVGAELVTNGEQAGRYLVLATVAAAALQAIAYFFGWGAAIGASLGVVEIWRTGKADSTSALVGGAILGGCVGYLAELAQLRFAILL